MSTALVMGFTNTYYTLWICEVSECAKILRKSFLQNLSDSYDLAKEKLSKKASELNLNAMIDLDLKGEYEYTKYVWVDNYEQDCFSFGKLAGEKILESTDLWQLARATEQETTPLRKELALQRYNEIYVAPIEPIEVRGHFFNDKDKVELNNLECLKTASFLSNYGYNKYIYYTTFKDQENRIFTSKSSNYLGFKEGNTYNLKATIKHSTYKDANNTEIQRIKVIE